jgi:DNA-binding NtrC family response regulator
MPSRNPHFIGPPPRRTTTHVTFPSATEPLVVKPRATTADSPLVHVLIVDSDARSAAQLASWFSRRGHAIVFASDVSEAKALLLRARFDLIVVEIDSHGRDPMTWVERLVEETEHPAVILTARHPRLETAIRAANLNLVGYLANPADPVSLGQIVDRVIGRHVK